VKRRRIWSEHLPPAEVTTPRVLSLLADASIQLLMAVFPHTREAMRDVVRACRDAGVSVGLWPMLEDEAGRWASADNGERYADFVRRVFDALGDELPDTLAIDLEPPIADVRRILDRDPRPLLRRALGRTSEPAGVRALVEIVDEVNARDVETLAALVPPLGAGWALGPGLERAIGTPLSRLRLRRAGPMLYTTLLTGYGRGVVRRRDATSLLAMLAEDTRRELGERAALSLGTVGTGALGDERIYDGPDDLALDVAVARAAGVDDLALFDLGGVLQRPPVDPWLSAFVDTAPAAAPVVLSKRARLLRAAVRTAGVALSGLSATGRSGRRPGPR
jgi:hypothetical protein